MQGRFICVRPWLPFLCGARVIQEVYLLCVVRGIGHSPVPSSFRTLVRGMRYSSFRSSFRTHVRGVRHSSTRSSFTTVKNSSVFAVLFTATKTNIRFLHQCVCVCVCACVRACVRACVCVCSFVVSCVQTMAVWLPVLGVVHVPTDVDQCKRLHTGAARTPRVCTES